MAYFENSRDVYDCIGGLFDWAGTQEELAKRYRATEMIIRLNYTEPDAVLTIDCKNPPKRKGVLIDWVEGDGGGKADVEFFMKTDVAHRFWLGKVNLLVALTKRDVVAKGPIFKVMKMLPLLKPLYEKYPDILAEKGKSELVEI